MQPNVLVNISFDSTHRVLSWNRLKTKHSLPLPHVRMCNSSPLMQYHGAWTKWTPPPNKTGQVSRVFSSFPLLRRDFASSSAVSNNASADGVASTTPVAGEPFIKSPYTNATRRTTWEKQSNGLASKGTVQVLTGRHSWECMHRIYIHVSWCMHPQSID